MPLSGLHKTMESPRLRFSPMSLSNLLKTGENVFAPYFRYVKNRLYFYVLAYSGKSTRIR